MSGELTECIEHEWCFEPGDWCPVCQGIKLEQERIIKLLLDNYQHRDFEGVRLDNPHNDNLDEAIKLIRGEK